MTVAGELALLMQIAMRSAAIGYLVAVVSDQPARWRNASAAGLRVVRDLPDTLPDGGRAMMVVYDLASTPAVHPSAAITVRAVERERPASLTSTSNRTPTALRSFAPRTSGTGCTSTSKQSATSSLP